ncbi:NTP transferase domain-containing protein [Actinoplanes sp. NPDC051859]|uniref:nucleotidyltransferase family protein n=1 Tax=Actinoplanes sp. NPDC051859 TaxID=3363909 RepID=UPI0037902E94
MKIAGLVLAAGGGRRFGRPKALVPWQGRTLVAHTAETSVRAGLHPTVVVIGAAADRVRAAAPGLDYVENPGWETGMASSLRAGLAALTPTNATAAVVLLVDMPGITPASVRRIAAQASPTALVTGTYAGRRGHPVLLGRNHWAAIARSATGDSGARDYLRAHAAEVETVPVDDVANDHDLDTPADLAVAERA